MTVHNIISPGCHLECDILSEYISNLGVHCILSTHNSIGWVVKQRDDISFVTENEGFCFIA